MSTIATVTDDDRSAASDPHDSQAPATEAAAPQPRSRAEVRHGVRRSLLVPAVVSVIVALIGGLFVLAALGFNTLRDDIAQIRDGVTADIDTLRDDVNSDIDALRSDMQAGFARVDQRFAQIDQRFAEVNAILLNHTDRLARIEATQDTHSDRLASIEATQNTHSDRLARIEAGQQAHSAT